MCFVFLDEKVDFNYFAFDAWFISKDFKNSCFQLQNKKEASASSVLCLRLSFVKLMDNNLPSNSCFISVTVDCQSVLTIKLITGILFIQSIGKRDL